MLEIILPYFNLINVCVRHSPSILDSSINHCAIENPSLPYYTLNDVLNLSYIHKTICNLIRTKSFSLDKHFGKQGIHKIRKESRLYTDCGQYRIIQGQLYEYEQETSDTTQIEQTQTRTIHEQYTCIQQDIPLNSYIVQVERHIYRSHPHSNVEFAIDILIDGNPFQLNKIQYGSSNLREDETQTLGKHRNKYCPWIIDWMFYTRQKEEELNDFSNVNKEIDIIIQSLYDTW